MKRFLIGFLISAAALFLLHITLFLLTIGKPAPSSSWIEDTLRHKETVTANTEGPKLLIVAGSGALFAVDSDYLAERFEKPVINLASHAGLQLPFILNWTENLAHEGDTILLLLEYEHYSFDGTVSQVFANFVTAQRPHLLSEDYGLATKVCFHFNIKELFTRLRIQPPPNDIVGFFDVQHLNARGDKLNATANLQDAIRIKIVESARPRALAFTSQSKSARLLDDWLSKLAQKNVKVIVGFPFTIDVPEHRSAGFIDQITKVRDYFSEHGAIVIMDHHPFLLARDKFFDSPYHPKAEYRRMCSEIMANEILRVTKINKSTP